MSRTVEVVYSGRFLEIHKDGRWEYVVRRSARGSVHVLAVTAARELVLVEQFRVPVQQRTLELPAGVLGDEAAHRGESIEDCARRELEEEAGYRGRTTRRLHDGVTAPGLSSEPFYIVQVEGLEQLNAGGGVDGEDITVHRVPLIGVMPWLEAQQRKGLLVDFRIYAALKLAGL